MHKAFRLLTAGAVMTLGPALLAQNNGQYNDPNYNNSTSTYNQQNPNNQSNPNYNNSNGSYGQSGTYNNGQSGTYNNNGQYDRDRDYNKQNRDWDRDRYYSNGQYTGNDRDYRWNGDVVPAGTELHVRADQTINVQKDSAQAGQVYPATVADDVRDQNGNVVIPRGARAALRLVSTDPNGNDNNGNLTLDLDSVEVGGRRYQIDAQGTSAVGSTNRGGLGANSRTGKYVGGGALAGTLLGALAGGGKGAAIGAIVGGAAGAGAQVMTRGKSLNVPAETVLNFRLQDAVTMRPWNRSSDPNYNNRNQLPPR